MTDVRSFRAESMQEALQIVRKEMGSDAVILHTRQVTHRRKLPWRKPKQEVEITAGLGVNVRQPTAQKRSADNTHVPSPSRQSAANRDNAFGGGAVDSQTGGVNADTVRMAKSRLAEMEATQDAMHDDPTDTYGPFHTVTSQGPALQQTNLQQAPLPSDHLPGLLPGNQPATSQPVPTATHTPAPLAANPVVPQSQPSSTAIAPLLGQAAQLQAQMETQPDGFTDSAELANKLDTIQQMLAEFGRTHRAKPGQEIPDELFHVYTDLIDSDVEEELAREFVFRLKTEATPDQLSDQFAAKALLAAMVEGELQVCNPIQTTPGQRKVVALVGPTGVGKTTTIAKLAANFRLRDSVRMGLVTVDTYRIAAVEQLRTYAEIIDLPMKVVTNPLEMRRALDELSGLDLVLIDTAGRSPRDELRIQELKSLLNEAHIDEAHLVLSMTSSARALKATADKFGAANISSLILTKLDEAPGLGGILSAARQIPFPVSYVTTGQDVPNDIEPANASRLSRLILGQDKLH